MKIEKNVPLPEGNPAGRHSKYPFGEMEVGDSMFFADEPMGTNSPPSNSAAQYGKRHGVKFTRRKTDGGVRIWRIE